MDNLRLRYYVTPSVWRIACQLRRRAWGGRRERRCAGSHGKEALSSTPRRSPWMFRRATCGEVETAYREVSWPQTSLSASERGVLWLLQNWNSSVMPTTKQWEATFCGMSTQGDQRLLNNILLAQRADVSSRAACFVRCSWNAARFTAQYSSIHLWRSSASSSSILSPNLS